MIAYDDLLAQRSYQSCISKFVLAFLLLGGLLSHIAMAGDEHEYAEIKRVALNIEDFNLKTADDKEEVNLARFIGTKKLVVIWYFAPWCANSKYEIPFLIKLHDKYKGRGFDIIGISNYAPLDELKNFLLEHKITFQVIYDTTEKNEATRLSSSHFKYRDAVGDHRKWGTPFSIFVENGDLTHVYVVSGEMIPEKAEKFVRNQLGQSRTK